MTTSRPLAHPRRTGRRRGAGAPSLQTLDAAAALTGADERSLRDRPGCQHPRWRGAARLVPEGPGRARGQRERPGGLVRRGRPLRRRGQRRRRGRVRRRGLRHDPAPAPRAPPTTAPPYGCAARAVEPRPQPGSTASACASSPAPTASSARATSPASGSRRPTSSTARARRSYGNHDLSDRPARQKIEYIVIHDTEASWATTLDLVQDPTYVSWHYSLRSVDGHIAQHVKAKDVGWHAGNWYVNAKSIGLEHEGFAAQGTWYTEAMYRTSAKLVRYLALRLGHPARPPAHHRPRQRPRHDRGDRRRHALGPGPVLGLVALLRPAAPPVLVHRHVAHGPGHDRPAVRRQPAGVHRLRRRPACPARRAARPR